MSLTELEAYKKMLEEAIERIQETQSPKLRQIGAQRFRSTFSELLKKLGDQGI